MIWTCYAHTIQNAKHAGLILSEPDEYGTPEWLGNRKQHALFDLLEANAELL